MRSYICLYHLVQHRDHHAGGRVGVAPQRLGGLLEWLDDDQVGSDQAPVLVIQLRGAHVVNDMVLIELLYRRPQFVESKSLLVLVIPPT